ncbi:TetR family transcriptional regulator [Nocardiopsis sp. CNT312]|uniref:TetR family transcriptional regulator n=1 Tax=Nocardiopsis sp. CNT312 TaxID=1137268 RepID=UPI00048C249E|nr:TetR family transcriptional regulator [Nocardiopsis sp. CNT312]
MDTRQRIVDAAHRLFYEQGFDRTSFASVAENPFVVHGVVTAEVVGVAPNLTDPRLPFLAA